MFILFTSESLVGGKEEKETTEPGLSVANNPSNDPISQKITKKLITEKPD